MAGDVSPVAMFERGAASMKSESDILDANDFTDWRCKQFIEMGYNGQHIWGDLLR